MTRLSAPYLNTCIPYLNTLTRLSAPYLNTCISYLITLTRLSAPYLNTCIPYLNTLTRLHILKHCRLGNQSAPSALGKSEHYVNRVVSQSESSITSPESSANQNPLLRHRRAPGAWRSLLGFRLESARYSLP